MCGICGIISREKVEKIDLRIQQMLNAISHRGPNAEGKVMTLEEATTLLTRVLVDLAQNAVHNKRLTDYADELERYILANESKINKC